MVAAANKSTSGTDPIFPMSPPEAFVIGAAIPTFMMLSFYAGYSFGQAES